MSNYHPIEKELRASLHSIRDAIEETLWPTRCVVCDTPGTLLCRFCRLRLPYLDQLRACPRCGAAHGRLICCECNQVTLTWKGLATFPLDGCVSATMLAAPTRRMIVMYKDRGEQRLAPLFARFIAESIPPAWIRQGALVPIPAQAASLRKRGFDHIGLIGSELARITHMPLLNALVAVERRDQRSLTAQQRLANMKGSFRVSKPLPPTVVLLDDVFTTGATLFAAADALRKQGAQRVFGLTFARA